MNVGRIVRALRDIARSYMALADAVEEREEKKVVVPEVEISEVDRARARAALRRNGYSVPSGRKE
jgi:hypothetical protein